MPREFPDVHDGDPIEPYHFNIIYAELRRWRKLKGTGGVSVSGAEGGGDPLISGDGGSGDLIAVLGGTLANATGSNLPTHQNATVLGFNPTAGSLATTGVSIKVWNDHDKTFASGSQVKVTMIGGAWFVYDVASCSSVS